MAHILKTKLPYYFYDINAVLPSGVRRWYDPYVNADNEDRKVLTKDELKYRYDRNLVYDAWLSKFDPIKGKQKRWQVIQILSYKHSESNRRDWWENYQDALFRVFVQPETIYDGKDWKQWYVLSPEDCELVNRYELEKTGPALPPRDTPYLSTDKRLRRMRLVPTECCRHWRHETTAGQLPEGL